MKILLAILTTVAGLIYCLPSAQVPIRRWMAYRLHRNCKVERLSAFLFFTGFILLILFSDIFLFVKIIAIIMYVVVMKKQLS